MDVDGKYGGDDLREEKKNEGDVKRGAAEERGFALEVIKKVEEKNEGGEKIDKIHFGEFKEFRIEGGEDEWGEEEEEEVEEADGFKHKRDYTLYCECVYFGQN